MRKDSANNKSNYSEKEPPNLDSRSRRFTLERVFGEGMSRTFFSLRRRRGFSPRHPAPVTIEDAGLVSGPGVGFALLHLSSCMFISSDNADRFLKLASTRGCTVSVGSEEARLRAGLRPPLKLYVPISGIQLSRRH